jgi:CrcB protein
MRARGFVAIAVGGAVGASCRWGLIELWPVDGGFPWPVFAVNVVGSFVVGVALAEQALHPALRPWARDAIGIGFCGGLTTFSTFAVETAGFVRDDRWLLAATYTTTSAVLTIAAAVAGALACRRVAGLTQPLEGDSPW